IVRAKHLLDKEPDAGDDQINRILSMHHCRCTGYVKIVDSIKLAADALKEHRQNGDMREAASQVRFSAVENKGSTAASSTNGSANNGSANNRSATNGSAKSDAPGSIGKSAPRYEARELALGERPFIDDMRFPGMLHGAVLLSHHPRALVKHIDPGPARAIEGVVDVITAADTPGRRHQGLIYNDWPMFVAEGEETRYVGDVIAAVAAVDRNTARRAAAAILVDYEVRAPITSPEAALAEGAPRLHEKGNLLSKSEIKRGDVDRAFNESAFVETRTFQTQFIEHMFLEPESCIAVPEGDRLTGYTQGQGVFDERRQIASFLGMS